MEKNRENIHIGHVVFPTAILTKTTLLDSFTGVTFIEKTDSNFCRVELKHLRPDTTYYYKCGNVYTLLSREYSFKTLSHRKEVLQSDSGEYFTSRIMSQFMLSNLLMVLID